MVRSGHSAPKSALATRTRLMISPTCWLDKSEYARMHLTNGCCHQQMCDGSYQARARVSSGQGVKPRASAIWARTARLASALEQGTRSAAAPVDMQVLHELFEIFLRIYLNAIRIQRPCQRCRVATVANARNLVGSKGQDLKIAANSAKGQIGRCI